MEQSNAPIPPPTPPQKTCPNCGSMQLATAPYCTNCGAPLQAPKSSTSNATKIIVSLALGVGALMFGAVGACFIWIGVGSTGFDPTFVLMVGVPALAALGCLVGIFLILRK